MVHLIDWANPMENDLQIAEEVTIQGESDRRPDLVVYVNGIALAVIELKRSTVSAHEGIRQNIRNQQDGYIPRFFTTIQLLFAGNDTEGIALWCNQDARKILVALERTVWRAVPAIAFYSG